MSASEAPRRTIVDELLGPFGHWSLGAVAVGAAAIAFLAHAGAAGRDLATPVFTISGTLVALILPAAGLSGAYLDPGLTFWTRRMAGDAAELDLTVERARKRIATMASQVSWLWRGFVFLLFSFPLSALALLRPSVTIGGYSAEELLIGAALALVVMAVFSFVPFTWAILNLDLAWMTLEKVATEPDDVPKGAENEAAIDPKATRQSSSSGGSRSEPRKHASKPPRSSRPPRQPS